MTKTITISDSTYELIKEQLEQEKESSKTKYTENYIPGSMGFAEGFLGPKGNVGFVMTLDRKKAKKIIKQLVKEGLEVSSAQVGLDGDWDINSEFIYENGKFLESTDIWESSVWAKPIMVINFNNSPSRTYEVWTKT